jgi:hypothetical protein
MPSTRCSSKPTWYPDYKESEVRPKTVLAYIILPCTRIVQGISEEESAVDTDDDWEISNTFNFVDIIEPELLKLTDQHNRQFFRAMNLLHLKPYFSPAQNGSINPSSTKPPKEAVKEKNEFSSDEMFEKIARRIDLKLTSELKYLKIDKS